MASLVDELIMVLKKEKRTYEKLSEFALQKKEILIAADIPALEKLTEQEQLVSDQLLAESHRQVALLNDIGNVLGRSEQMTVSLLITALLHAQPEVAEQLERAKTHLLEAAEHMQELNRQNEVLLRQAIELTEFDITLFKSLRQAPETANYNRDAYNTGSILGSSRFDAKQ